MLLGNPLGKLNAERHISVFWRLMTVKKRETGKEGFFKTGEFCKL